MSRFRFSLAVALVALALASPARANLIVNGGFETGDFTGWTPTIVGGFPVVNNISPYAGTYKAAFGTFGSLGSISQTVTTGIGQTYVLSFELDNPVGGTNEFLVQWDGGTLIDIVDAAAFGGYTLYTFTVTGTGSDTLSFSGRNDAVNGVFRLDEVQLNVPEPASLAILGTGLFGFGVARRKRQRRAG